MIVTAVAFLVPFDVLMLAVSNTLFLIYPVRFAQGTSADFQLVGRMMLFMLLQFLILIPGPGHSGGLGRPRVCAQRLSSGRSSRSSPGSCSWPNCRSGCSCSPRCSSGLIPAPRRRRERASTDGPEAVAVCRASLFSTRALAACAGSA